MGDRAAALLLTGDVRSAPTWWVNLSRRCSSMRSSAWATSAPRCCACEAMACVPARCVATCSPTDAPASGPRTGSTSRGDNGVSGDVLRPGVWAVVCAAGASVSRRVRSAGWVARGDVVLACRVSRRWGVGRPGLAGGRAACGAGSRPWARRKNSSTSRRSDSSRVDCPACGAALPRRAPTAAPVAAGRRPRPHRRLGLRLGAHQLANRPHDHHDERQ